MDTELLQSLNERFAGGSPQQLIAWAAETYGGRLALSCSFGGASGMVLLDLALQIDRSVAVVYVDTDYLFPETYETVRAVEGRYGINVLGFRSSLSPKTQELLCGPALWLRDPDRCCELRKVEPMRAALANYDAYLTGLRRDQAGTRSETPLVQWDAKFGLYKLNPLADWTEKDLWARIAERDLPYHPLHDRGYSSIGCAPCTQPGSGREGRWAGTDKVECGIHVVQSG